MANGVYVALAQSNLSKHMSPERFQAPKTSSGAPHSPHSGVHGPPLNGGNREGRDSLEDFYTEINDIEQDDDEGNDGQGSDEEQSKPPDEGEQEVVWLQEAGYGHLASHFVEGKEIDEDLIKDDTSSLTRAQAAAVRKRVDTLNATIRKKQKQKLQHKTDVRDVFSAGAESGGSKGGVVIRQSSHEHAAQRRSSARGSTFLKNRGTYSMIEPGDVKTGKGIETLSIQARSSQAQLRSHSADSSGGNDEDATTFNVEEGGAMPSPKMDKDTKPKSKGLGPDGLPNFVLVKETLGITRIDDLGKNDVVKLHSLALIELTALFDIHNISYSRRKPKRRVKENGVFGVPLQTLYDHDVKKVPSVKVPLIFSNLVQFLIKSGVHEEGILRVPGAVARIKSLRHEIEEKFNSGRFSWDDMRPHDCAGLLKQFLRDLPVPLLTFQYIEAFAAVQKIPDSRQQLQALNLLVLLLPDVHRNTLQLLLRFLKRVADCKENKMTMNNVAMIMAPNLFLVQSRGSKAQPQKRDLEISMAAGTSNIVKMLIKYQDILWSVPSFMIAQIRHQYEADQQRSSGNKSIMKFLGRKDKSETPKKPQVQHEGDFQAGVIRVQAPHLNMSSTAVQLDTTTSASDIVARFCHSSVVESPRARNRDSSHEEGVELPGSPCLYELGGNIGERKLEGDTNMLALYRVNPNAEWVIRTKPD